MVVDGVYRHSHTYLGRSVSLQKNKKLDFETFLYQTSDGVIDTEMKVAPFTPIMTTPVKQAPETIGTLELRIYVLRSFGDEHTLGDVQTYYKINDDAEDESEEFPTYRVIAPDFRMTFETNCAALDKPRATREKKKMDSKRPGKEPWAILRFHYRSKGEYL